MAYVYDDRTEGDGPRTHKVTIGTVYVDGTKDHHLSESCLMLGLEEIRDWEEALRLDFLNYDTEVLIPLYYDGEAYPNAHALYHALCSMRSGVRVPLNRCTYVDGVPVGPDMDSDVYQAIVVKCREDMSPRELARYSSEKECALHDAMIAQFSQWSASRDALIHTGFENLVHHNGMIQQHLVAIRSDIMPSAFKRQCHELYNMHPVRKGDFFDKVILQ